jgi:hypothetical protein
MEWIVFLAGIVLGAAVGYAVGFYRGVLSIVDKLIKDQEFAKKFFDTVSGVRKEQDQRQNSKEQEPAVSDFTVERINNCYYAYADQKFLGQGQDFKTMIADIKQRFPDKIFFMKSYQATLTEEESQKLVESIRHQYGKNAVDDSQR